MKAKYIIFIPISHKLQPVGPKIIHIIIRIQCLKILQGLKDFFIL